MPEIRSLVEQLTDGGFSVVVISHRGIGFDPFGKPAMLKSGRIFSGCITSDFIGPATYINEKYGRGRQIFAVGISMGGMILSLAIPKCPFLTAAICLSTPNEVRKIAEEMEKAPFNLYQRTIGKVFLNNLERNKHMMTEVVKEKCGVDLVTKIREMRAADEITITDVDEVFQGPLNGFKGHKDYYEHCSSVNSAHAIRIPTVFFSAENDPLFRMNFDKKVFKTNPNVALVTTPSGGHVAHHESFCNYQLWLAEPVIHFFSSF